MVSTARILRCGGAILHVSPLTRAHGNKVGVYEWKRKRFCGGAFRKFY